MMTHRKIHFGVLLFTCDICDKKFSQKGNMLTHKKYHTGDRPFDCDLCTQSFIQKICMIRHRQSHSDMPNYTELQYKELNSFSCEICHKYFNSKGNYLKHKAKHFNKKLKISISKLRHNSKENVDKCKARKANKTQNRKDSFIQSKKLNILQQSENNILKLKYQKVKQVRVNIEKMNIGNIFNIWDINVINQHDDIINQDGSNHSITIESKTNVEITDTSSKGEVTGKDVKDEQMPSMICISTADNNDEKEEITILEHSKFLSDESKVSNAIIEKEVIKEENVREVQNFSDIKQVRVNIEKINIENIFSIWGINVINQHDDVINQDTSNQSMTIKSKTNVEVTDTTSNVSKGELSLEDIKDEKIPSKICIPITYKKVEKEEIFFLEHSKFLSDKSKVSNALSKSLEFDKSNKSTESNTNAP